MRVIVTGGGTGGHIYPALAIARGLRDKVQDCEILYVGTRQGMEAKLVPEAGWRFSGVSGQGLPRKMSWESLKTVARSFQALWQTKEILRHFGPDLVVGTGGYVSGPVVLTAAMFGIPTLLHEQNALPGITNRILARVVKRVTVTFPESLPRFRADGKAVLTGLPVRPDIGKVSRAAGAKHFSLRPERLTLLVTGGSRGARTLNQAMLTVLEKLALRSEVQVIWATGSNTYQETLDGLRRRGIDWERPNWRILEYLKDMPQAYAAADLCLSRAGAASLAELMAAGKPSVLIPYPFAAENHQEYNARALVEAGAARLILDKELTGQRLWQEVEGLLADRALLGRMGAAARGLAQPEALSKIVDLCLETAWK
ncbi:lactose synthase/undecaprenyldiphospho-muramoylpentapeptide beta-N-acetylglucosaminyltransferase [Acididesulfobacillus acetoxydans]|uniref:UDP-N-acetylglucosamine--N-acetylmuramyl-(pentapeptide) pyrophosphoryl-undecaprenol N-acetylglucosamine transferase n=1 Tax=Acididesulfobacillus acetoxydans TaxID=1561005 RepID=A0A8S0W573_9FIRM|nr:undecaprenyldiphospho-muramoylpentapeptide beta-N-acetylglucosaminyltransferase [Acididesulfobacillus acetoxydans]CAA7602888.1 lactose synthase/undecaprenyldiphospho-muramoylpentapeptide beta-N-acetylglucosaminyltransferase [Acididesulfobacillus acetoxydans]CEJ05769.1 UDP-N-acetylglucosamine--N-acetylmuramyl-(pentapeptide) pyrophosphoryl-undecaprenol N-acetylglucosamine transferase [Acididesulfobacillus acetoxydans]